MQTKKINWKTLSGLEVTVTLDYDGKLEITADIETLGVVGTSSYPNICGRLPGGCVAKIGKLAMNQENYDRVIEAARSLTAADDARMEAEGRDYDNHRAAMAKAMGY